MTKSTKATRLPEPPSRKSHRSSSYRPDVSPSQGALSRTVFAPPRASPYGGDASNPGPPVRAVRTGEDGGVVHRHPLRQTDLRRTHALSRVLTLRASWAGRASSGFDLPLTSRAAGPARRFQRACFARVALGHDRYGSNSVRPLRSTLGLSTEDSAAHPRVLDPPSRPPVKVNESVEPETPGAVQLSTCLATHESRRCVLPVRENRLASSHLFTSGSLEAASTAFRVPPSASVCGDLAIRHTRRMRTTSALPSNHFSTSCTRARPSSVRSRLRVRALTRTLRTGEVSRPDANRWTLRFHDGLPALAGPSSVPAGCLPEVLDEDRPLTSLSPVRVCRTPLSQGYDRPRTRRARRHRLVVKTNRLRRTETPSIPGCLFSARRLAPPCRVRGCQQEQPPTHRPS